VRELNVASNFFDATGVGYRRATEFLDNSGHVNLSYLCCGSFFACLPCFRSPVLFFAALPCFSLLCLVFRSSVLFFAPLSCFSLPCLVAFEIGR